MSNSIMELWSGRVDQEQPAELALRLHQIIQPLEQATESGIAILGFCSDEGVRRNHGRVGAAHAPNQIRPLLANLPWLSHECVYEAGNVVCHAQQLERAHQDLAIRVSHLLKLGHLPVVLGGGHEVAYGSWLGLAQYLEQQGMQAPKVGIINFDAHFDLRSDTQGCNSGTPFYQIAQGAQQRGWPFHYCCLGISEMANTQALFKRADDWQVTYRLDRHMTLNHLSQAREQLAQFIADCSILYLTFDLDVLPASVASGVSAPAPCGVSLEVIEVLLNDIRTSGKLRLVDIAEYNPQYDQDKQTARVVARLFYTLFGVQHHDHC